MKTTNKLRLPLAFSGHVQMQRSVKRAFEILDESVEAFRSEKKFTIVSTADASDATTTQALANALKAKVNEMAAETFVVKTTAV